MTSPEPLPIFSGGGQLAPLQSEPAEPAEPAELDPTRIVTLSCTETGCNHTVTGPAGGRGSATWKLGTHRHNKHKKKADGSPDTSRKRAKAGEPSAEVLAAQPVLGSVRAVAAAVGTGRTGPPSAADLTAGLGRGLQLVVQAGAALAVETDPNISNHPDDERTRDLLIDTLTITESTAMGIMSPVGRLLAPTGLNKSYGRAIVENTDVIGAFAELAMIGMRWRAYLHSRSAQQSYRPAATLPPAPVFTPPQQAESTPLHQVVAEAGAPAMLAVQQTVHGQQVLTTPPPTQGRVISAADVLAMRAAANAA